jgi:hypothetical protein
MAIDLGLYKNSMPEVSTSTASLFISLFSRLCFDPLPLVVGSFL